MKIISSFAFSLTLTLFLVYSCSEEIKPSTDGKQTAVVYCILNAKDSIHYVKINKAFYGGGDLTQTATIPDSSYFEQIDATIKEYVSGNLTRTFELMDTIIGNKEPGAFYAPEQKLYYFKTTGSAPLSTATGTVYKLEANINDGEFTVKGETPPVGGMTISQPTENSQFSFATDNVEVYGYGSTNIGFSSGTAKRIEVFLEVSFEEYTNSTLVNTKTFNWKLSEIDQEDIKTTMSVAATGQTFYTLIAQNATDDPSINKRLLKGINIRLNGASNDLQKYLALNKPSSSLAQTKPSYTNLTATNGMRVIGIMAARYHVERYKPKYVNFGGNYLGCLNNASMKELCSGQFTGPLMFCSDNPADASKSYFCD